MIENILIVDTETTGLEPSKGATIIEIGAVLYNLKHKSILQQFSTLLPCETNPVEHINRIKPEATQVCYPFVGARLSADEVEKMWNNPETALVGVYEEKISLNAILIEMAKNAQACVAHNAQFDKKFVALLSCGDALLNNPWICTKNDFIWPMQLSRKRLEDICNGMHVPYVDAHRALNDCSLLAQCFTKVYDLEERFNEPSARAS